MGLINGLKSELMKIRKHYISGVVSVTKTEAYLPKDAVFSFSKLMENTSDNVQFLRNIIL